MNEKRTGSYRIRRALSLLTALLMLFPTACLLAPAASAAEDHTMIYCWKRVYTQNDIPDYSRVILMWKEGGTWYMTSGNGYSEYTVSHLFTADSTYIKVQGVNASSFSGVGPGDDTFCTVGDCDAWYLRRAKDNNKTLYDKDNHNQALVTFERADGTYLGTDGGDGLVWKNSQVTNKSYRFTVTTSEKAGSYAKQTGVGCVQLLREVDDGTDGELKPCDSSCLKMSTNSGYNYYDFLMYVSSDEYFNNVGYATVRSGSVLKINGQTILNSGETLTVEPGAVLSIQGSFINNGTILNYGTVILNENACMTSMTEAETVGEMYNYGSLYKGGGYVCTDSVKRICEGKLIVMENAVLSLYEREGNTLWLIGGATCVVRGVLVVPYQISLDFSELEVADCGAAFIGFSLPANPTEARKAGALLPAGFNFYILEGGKVVDQVGTGLWGGIDTTKAVSGVRNHVRADGVLMYYQTTGAKNLVIDGKNSNERHWPA